MLLFPPAFIFMSAVGYNARLISYFAVAAALSLGLVALLVLRDRPTIGHGAVSAISVGILFSVALTHWPLRITFNLARTRLDQIASQVQAGQSVERENAGLYLVLTGRRAGDEVILEIGGRRMTDVALVKTGHPRVDDLRLGSGWAYRELR